MTGYWGPGEPRVGLKVEAQDGGGVVDLQVEEAPLAQVAHDPCVGDERGARQREEPEAVEGDELGSTKPVLIKLSAMVTFTSGPMKAVEITSSDGEDTLLPRTPAMRLALLRGAQPEHDGGSVVLAHHVVRQGAVAEGQAARGRHRGEAVVEEGGLGHGAQRSRIICRGWPGTPRRPRCGSTAAAAAALTEVDGSSMPPSSSEDEPADPVPQASAAATAMSPRAPRLLPVYHYTSDRERDTVETELRRTSSLCLKCLPSGRIHPCPCPLHPSNPRDSSAPRCFPYSALLPGLGVQG